MVKRDTDRYDLRIKTARGTAVIGTTTRHLFWDLSRHQWVKADTLARGSYLRTPAGASVTVLGGYTLADAADWMWDISVPGGGDHDFYVDTTIAAILVHNCALGNPKPKWKQCIEAIGIAVHMFMSAHSGQMVPGNPPSAQYEIFEPAGRGTEAGAPPRPGGDSGGGGEPDEGGGC